MLPATFRQIEVFIAVVEAGSIAGCAEKLSISSASVSNHIKAFEKQIDCPLFIRQRGRRVVLSEIGRRVYDRGVELMRQAELMAQDIAPNRRGKRRRLTIASQRFLAQTFLAEAVSEFSKNYQDIEIVLETGKYEDVIEHMSAGAAELGYVVDYSDQIDLPSTIVGRERLGFFAAADHPTLSKQPVSIKQLSSFSFFSTKKNERFGHMISQAMASIGLDEYSVVSQIQDGALIGELVSRGGGIACSPIRSFATLLKSGKLVEINVDAPELMVNIHQIQSPNGRSDRSLEKFVQQLNK